MIKNVIKKQKGINAKTIGIGAGTCAGYFRNAGFDAAVWSTTNGTEHLPDEHASVKNLIEDTKIMAHLLASKI